MALPPKYFPENLPTVQMLTLSIEYYLIGNELFGRTAIDIALDKEVEELSRLEVDTSLYESFKEGLLYNKLTTLPVELPPRSVPVDLDQQEYLELGKTYKSIGWTEQAREALGRALNVSQSEKFKSEVRQFIDTQLPRLPVPHQALERNIKAANLLLAAPEKSVKLFVSLIEDYPQFEYPYSNLAFAYLKLGKMELAVATLEEVLMLNSSYYNAWLNLAKARALDDDYERSYDCLRKASLLHRNSDLDQLEKLVTEHRRLSRIG